MSQLKNTKISGSLQVEKGDIELSDDSEIKGNFIETLRGVKPPEGKVFLPVTDLYNNNEHYQTNAQIEALGVISQNGLVGKTLHLNMDGASIVTGPGHLLIVIPNDVTNGEQTTATYIDNKALYVGLTSENMSQHEGPRIVNGVIRNGSNEDGCRIDNDSIQIGSSNSENVFLRKGEIILNGEGNSSFSFDSSGLLVKSGSAEFTLNSSEFSVQANDVSINNVNFVNNDVLINSMQIGATIMQLQTKIVELESRIVLLETRPPV